MDDNELLAKYNEALQTILELELQIWELCSQNSQLRQALEATNSAEFAAEQERGFYPSGQDRATLGSDLSGPTGFCKGRGIP